MYIFFSLDVWKKTDWTFFNEKYNTWSPRQTKENLLPDLKEKKFPFARSKLLPFCILVQTKSKNNSHLVQTNLGEGQKKECHKEPPLTFFSTALALLHFFSLFLFSLLWKRCKRNALVVWECKSLDAERMQKLSSHAQNFKQKLLRTLLLFFVRLSKS